MTRSTSFRASIGARKTTRRLMRGVFLALWLAPGAGHAAVELLLVPEKSSVRYEIDHSLGAVKDVAGTPAGRIEVDSTNGLAPLAGRVTVDLRQLKTGVDQRDKHIKSDEYLDVARFPGAEFEFTGVSADSSPTPPDSLPPGAQRARVKGKLQLHGVTRDVEIPVTLVPEAGGLRVRGGWTLALEDYAIKRPKKMMLSAGKTVAVRVDLLFAP